MLWFIRDNSVNTKVYYGLDPDKLIMVILMTRNVYSTCLCEIVETSFTHEELEFVSTMIDKLSKISGGRNHNLTEEYTESGLMSNIANKINYNERNRIARAVTFLHIARSANFTLTKLSLYMNIYECLFTTDTSEVVHKFQKEPLVIIVQIRLNG